jgi:hypothetical protein
MKSHDEKLKELWNMAEDYEIIKWKWVEIMFHYKQ